MNESLCTHQAISTTASTNVKTEDPTMSLPATTRAFAIAVLILLGTADARAAGTLTPVNTPEQPIQIRDHHVNVVINNGFACTEVLQTFYNPNDVDLEAIYAFPVPTSASLSEVTIYIGEDEIQGEVLTKDEAERIYGEERDRGNDAGLAQKKEYDTFEFRVTPVRAQDETRLRFVYYQPLEIDTGIGRYVYPLEDGGTDECAKRFWLNNEVVEDMFSVDLELKFAYPLTDVRLPGFEAATTIDELDDGHYRVHVETQGAALNRDFVLYYRLQDNLPGRVELVAYRAETDKPGTFMLVVTPGLDLQPITEGADYLFVLDVSGSMQGKIQTLAHGVCEALGQMHDDDRFRIITFNSYATELTRGWLDGTTENVRSAIDRVATLSASGSTNMFAGVDLALQNLDDDRATSIVLVTDAVTNTGVVDPEAFYDLLGQYDIRLFGFLMGNNANWPLMRMICETTGGFYARVSNADDVIGQILLAKSKITYEALHDAELTIDGVKVFECSDRVIGKVYRGQQLVLFGRYAQGGVATVTLNARLTGEDRSYTTTFEFPDLDTDNPEIERLWALDRIEETQILQQAGLLLPSESENAIEDLGVAYQLVTDYTSMIVLPDDVFDEYGVERRNLWRTTIEHEAQARRAGQPVRYNRVDEAQPMFQHDAPAVGGGQGGGAISPVGLALLGLPLLVLRRRKVSR
jgi:Ca-activated chloride channel family protein